MNRTTFLAALLASTAAGANASAAVTIDLNNPQNANQTVWKVAPGTDVTVIGSTTPRTRQLSIEGARNVEVKGGVWKPTSKELTGTIHTKNITGSITVDGAYIDNSGAPGADGVVVNAGGTTAVPFVMRNSTITGIRGKQNGAHADGVQPQGAVSTFQMENVKIATDYQGLMLADQPSIAYGGKVRDIKLTDVSITKLPGGESGCRYPVIVGGNQSVSLDNVTVYDQSGCRGNGVLNVDNRARISGSTTYDDSGDDEVSGSEASSSEGGSSSSFGDYQSDSGGGYILAAAGGSLGGSCSGSNALSTAMAAAGAVASIWSGGRATAPLQVSQQLQPTAQRICQTESLLAQLRMLSGMDLRTADQVLSVLRRLEPMLRQADFLMTDEAIVKAMQESYPEAFPEGSTYQDMQAQQIIWNGRTRKALDQKSRIENSVIQSQQAALGRAGQIEQAGRASGGIRGAQLATNAILVELMGALNGQLAVTTSHHRALSEVQYREEAEKAAAKRDAKDFMKGLGDCPACGTRSINLFGGGSAAMQRGRSANDVFGTGAN